MIESITRMRLELLGLLSRHSTAMLESWIKWCTSGTTGKTVNTMHLVLFLFAYTCDLH